MAKITGEQQQNERRAMARMAVGLQIRNGDIKTFADIFAGHRFAKTYLVEDLGMGHPRITKLILNPGTLSLDDCITLGQYFDIPAATIALLGFNQIPQKKKPR